MTPERWRLLMVIITLVLALPAKARADFEGRGSPAQEFEAADVVFEGWLIGRSVDGKILRFSVARAWKGIETRESSLARDNELCWTFDKHPPPGRYYVFARVDRPDDEHFSAGCYDPMHAWTDYDGAVASYLAGQPESRLSGPAPLPHWNDVPRLAADAVRWMPFMLIHHWRWSLLAAVALIGLVLTWRRRRQASLAPA